MICKRSGCQKKARVKYCSDYCRRRAWRETHPLETKLQRKREKKSISAWDTHRQNILKKYGVSHG